MSILSKLDCLHCGHSRILVTPAFVEKTLPQALQTRKSLMRIIIFLSSSEFLTCRKTPALGFTENI